MFSSLAKLVISWFSRKASLSLKSAKTPVKTDLYDQAGATNQLTPRILAFISFSKGFFMINLVQIRQFIMKTKRVF